MKNTLLYLTIAIVSSLCSIASCIFYDSAIRMPIARDAFEKEAVQTGYAQFSPKTRIFEWKRADLLANELFISNPVSSLFPMPKK